MAGSGFDFQKLINDSKAALTNPKSYFSTMPKTGGFGEPVIKALVYGLVAGIITLIWSLLHLLGPASGMWSMFGASAGGVMIIIGALISAVIGLFVGGIICLIISAICGGETNFEANVRVVAAMMVLSPVSSLLGFFSGISLTLGALVSLIVSLYGLYMLYNALIGSLNAKEGTAKVVSIILAVIPAIMLISTLMCASAATKFADTAFKDLPSADSKDMNDLKDKLQELKDLQEKN